MTGCVFLSLTALLSGREPVLADTQQANLNATSLTKHGNKLNLYLLDHFLDITDMHSTLSPFSPNVLRSYFHTYEDVRDMCHVFHLQFNQTTQAKDIFGLFYGIPVQIKWINDTAAFIIVSDKNQLPTIHEVSITNE